MAAFGADGRCLMRALQEELDDPEPADCGRCAVCTAPRFDGAAGPGAGARRPALHLRAQPLLLEVKKMAPDADGAMRKIPDGVRAEQGRALARLGDGGWDPLVQAAGAAGGSTTSWWTRRPRLVRGGGRAGRLGDGRAVDAQRAARAGLRRAAGGGARAAVRAGARAGRGAAAAARDGEHAAAGRQRARRVRGRGRAARRPVLLVDDLRFSGWTLAMLAGQLRRAASRRCSRSRWRRRSNRQAEARNGRGSGTSGRRWKWIWVRAGGQCSGCSGGLSGQGSAIVISLPGMTWSRAPHAVREVAGKRRA